jgi:hypothetical protein
MKVSVLVPSRERADMLWSSVTSLGDGDYEVLVYVDNDDPQKPAYILQANKNTSILFGPRHTYRNLHEYYNQLAKLARGDWLMLWNDDAEMLSTWMTKLPEATKPEVLNLYDENPLNNLFPLISRQMYEAMGHFSLSPHNDSWVQDIANTLGIHTHVPGVTIKHHREDIDDSTKRDTQAWYGETSPAHYAAEMQELMAKDIERIRRVAQ